MSGDSLAQYAACVSAVRQPTRMPGNARLWLASASLAADSDGRTTYSAGKHIDHTISTWDAVHTAIEWLVNAGLVIHDTQPDGDPCLRLMHFDFNAPDKIAAIGGYGPDRLSPRDHNPPPYGRPVEAVIDSNPGADYQAPTWTNVAPVITTQARGRA